MIRLTSVLKRLLPLFLLMNAACSSAPPCPTPQTGDVVYVVESGWHAEIGLPVEELGDNLAFLRETFPGARYIMIGYGKKTFFTAPVQTFREYFLGPLPGPAVIHVVGLNVSPAEAYPTEDTVTLMLQPEGTTALSSFIADDFLKDTSNKPHVVANSHNPEGLFYAAKSEYNLLHTCNSWTAEALHSAGLPVSGKNISLSGQVMTQVNKVAEAQCSALLVSH